MEIWNLGSKIQVSMLVLSQVSVRVAVSVAVWGCPCHWGWVWGVPHPVGGPGPGVVVLANRYGTIKNDDRIMVLNFYLYSCFYVTSIFTQAPFGQILITFTA